MFVGHHINMILGQPGILYDQVPLCRSETYEGEVEGTGQSSVPIHCLTGNLAEKLHSAALQGHLVGCHKPDGASQRMEVFRGHDPQTDQVAFAACVDQSHDFTTEFGPHLNPHRDIEAGLKNGRASDSPRDHLDHRPNM